MGKPGNSPNVANPEVSAMRGISDAAMVGAGSNQTSATTQTASMNPQRLVPPQQPAGPSGRAEVDRDGVLDGITSDYSQSQRNGDRQRKKQFVSNP